MSMTIPDVTFPAVIQHKLRRIRRRQFSFTLARGLSLGAAALLLGMLIGIGLDLALTPVHSGVRLAITVAALAPAAAVLAIALRRLRQGWRLNQVAAVVDDQVPHLQQRWTTVTDGASRGTQPPGTAGAMFRLVTSEAVAMAQLVQPSRIATAAQLHRAAMLCCITAAVLALFLAADWPHRRILLQRFWMPLAPITATQLDGETGDVVLPRGGSLEIALRQTGIPRDGAYLEVVHEDQSRQSLTLQVDADDPQRLSHRIESLADSFHYRGVAGDGRSRWYSVTAIDPPSLAETRVTLVAPDYVQRPDYEKPYLPQRLSAVEGSRLMIEFLPAEPPTRFELQLTSRNDDATTTDEPTRRSLSPTPGDGWYRFEIELTHDLTISPWMISHHGLTMADHSSCFIRVIPDRPPVVKITYPNEETAVTPDDVVDVNFEAHDDYGIARAELVVYRHGIDADEPPTLLAVREIPLDDQQDAKEVRGTAQLDLAEFDLPVGTSLSYSVRVADRRPMAAPRPAMLPPQDRADPSKQPQGDEHASPPGQVTNATESPAAERSLTDLAGDTATSADPGSEPGDAMAADDAQAGGPEDAGATEVADETKTDETKTDSTNAGVTTTSETSAEANAETSAESNPASNAETSAAKPGAGGDESSADAAEEAGRATPNDETSNDAPSAPGQDAASEINASPAAGATDDDDGTAQAPKVDVSGDAGDQETQRDEPVSGSELDAPASADTDEAESGDAFQPEPLEQEMRGGDDDRGGQDAESKRLQLRIVAPNTAGQSSEDEEEESARLSIRQRLEQIDAELEVAEEMVDALWQAATAAALDEASIDRLGQGDAQLAKVERLVAQLRSQSDETPLAFVGLQMVDIASAQVAPARDRLFAVLSHADVDAEPQLAEAVHHVRRARELLAELLARYERVVRERQLADALEEAAQIYEVYVANMQRILRPQSAPSPNPLQRDMAILDYQQEYLDRLREVIQMRRDLNAELARMLADDPRLLSRFTDLLMRRQTSLRDQLTQLHRRQQEIAEELAGWRGVDEAQRDAVWMLVTEVRMHDLAQLARQVVEMQSRGTAQLPLELSPDHRWPAVVLDRTGQLAIEARSLAAKARRLLADPFDDSIDLAGDIERMVQLLSDLEVALTMLQAEHPGQETEAYVNNRRADAATIGQTIGGWLDAAGSLQRQQYERLAASDQRQLAMRTEAFRLAMQDIDNELPGGFQGETPEDILQTVRELAAAIEAITFNQAAATYALTRDDGAAGHQQQTLALQQFALAEELFDQLRRQIIEQLDQEEPNTPSAADLEDPTLDQLLARLEDEPDLIARLGIPDRPTNLRQTAEWMQWNEQGGNAPDFNMVVERARQRAEAEQLGGSTSDGDDESEDDDLSDSQWQEIADAEAAAEQMQQRIEELRRLAAAEDIDAVEAERLRRAADQLEEMRGRLQDEQMDDQQWREWVRSEQLRAMLEAAALGQPLPEERWNQIQSSLGDGLWQVQRRTPPEGYRQAIEQYQQRINRLRQLMQ